MAIACFNLGKTAENIEISGGATLNLLQGLEIFMDILDKHCVSDETDGVSDEVSGCASGTCFSNDVFKFRNPLAGLFHLFEYLIDMACRPPNGPRDR